MSDLIQCSCGGWMSPVAIACPTCGIAVGVSEIPKSNLGWKIVRMFWSVVIVGIVMLLIFA